MSRGTVLQGRLLRAKFTFAVATVCSLQRGMEERHEEMETIYHVAPRNYRYIERIHSTLSCCSAAQLVHCAPHRCGVELMYSMH